MTRNHYLELPDLSAFANLIVLELDDNSIAAIDKPLPPTLARLNLDCNALRKLDRTLIPATCTSVSDFSNPVSFFWKPPVVHRVHFGGVGGRGGDDDPPKAANVYVNAHNIHDSGVQGSTKANIAYLVNYRKEVPYNPALFDEINAVYSPVKAKITSCFSVSVNVNTTDPTLPGNILRVQAQTPYIMHGVTFKDLVDRIWLRIKDTADPETKSELQKRFAEEVKEGRAHCMNGMMVRLVNVFLGFDPNVQVKLNPNQILQARVPATMERIKKQMGLKEGDGEPLEFWLRCYKETIQDLEDLEVGLRASEGEAEAFWHYEDWEPWITPLADPILDELYDRHGWTTMAKTELPPVHLTEAQEIRNKELPEEEKIYSISCYIRKIGLRCFPWELNSILERCKLL